MNLSKITNAEVSVPDFLSGDGEMGERIRSLDWYNLFMQMPAAVAIYRGPNFIVELVNDKMLEFYGKTREEIINRPIFEVFPDVAAHGVEALHRKVYETGERVIAKEQRHEYYKNGKLYNGFFNTVFEPFRDLNNNITGLIVTGHEVTEEVLARKKIEESENLFRLALSGSDQIVFSQDTELKHTWIYNAHPDFKPEEIIGKTDMDLHIPQTAEVLTGLKKWVLHTGQPLHKEVEIEIVGQQVVYDLRIEAIKDTEGKITGIIGVTTDITQRTHTEKKIKESEEGFRSLANSIPQLAWMTDSKGWIYWYNQRWFDYTGTTLEDMEGWGWQTVHHPELIDGVVKRFKSAIETGEAWEDTFLLRSKEGEYRWFLSRALPIRNEKGEITQWFGTNTDISGQRQIEEALKNTKEQLELTFQNVPSAIYQFDKKGKILYLNEKGAMQLGYSTVEEVLAEKDVFQFRKKLDKTFIVLDQEGKPLSVNQSSAAITFTTGKPSEVVSQLIHRETGSSFWLLSKSSPLYNEKGELSIVLTTSTDITLQKKSEQSIRQNEEKFRTLAETLPQLVWMTDENGVQEYASKRWMEYTGLEPKDEKTWEQIVHPGDIKSIANAWINSLQTGQTYHAEVRLKNKEGEYRWHFVQGTPIRNEDGKIVKWIGSFTDIHDQKTIAEKLELLVDERTKKLQRSNEDLQQFAHVASHDLKEPVRKIKTFGGRLKHEFGNDLPDKAKTYLEKLESAADRVYAMIEGVLIYSSVDSEVVSSENIDLNEVISNIESDLEVLIAQKNAALNYLNLPSIEGSSILMYQLFYNLINNSLKFSKAGTVPLIEITTENVHADDLRNRGMENEENYVKLILKDNGIGFSSDEQENIFKTFSRLHPKDQYEGTGLGLALCKKIVERHGGVIDAKGAEDNGASFTIILPRKQFDKLI